MKLSQPKNAVFFISVLLIVVGLVVKFVMATGDVALFSSYELGFWITFVGGGLLALGNLLKGL